MADQPPSIWWIRRDLRISDNAALRAAVEAGGPVIPLFILDEVVEGHGAAPTFRLGLGVETLARSLQAEGSRLVLRRGRALDMLRALVEETGARTVVWSRLYDPDSKARDTRVKQALGEDGVAARSVNNHLLFEPWTVETKEGGFYKVYSPFWRAVKDIGPEAPLSRPSGIPAPKSWPRSDRLENWAMGSAMNRGAAIVARHAHVGEDQASSRLGAFMAHRVGAYRAERNLPAVAATSGLSENLAYGEIGPRRIWAAGMRAREDGKSGAETFLKELVWREFAYHLLHHTPRLADGNWREKWDAFPWNTDERRAEVKAWKQARTGIPFVDAAMREMYVTGRMHNRARMIVASYLTKHLMCHWRIGQKWFEKCLIDWDPASNALGWQWTAGSGPDAAPYFRVFNPETQLNKFDPNRDYVDAWIAEDKDDPAETALDYFRAIPRRWSMAPEDPYPDPVVGVDEGRKRAMDAYENRAF